MMTFYCASLHCLAMQVPAWPLLCAPFLFRDLLKVHVVRGIALDKWMGYVAKAADACRHLTPTAIQEVYEELSRSLATATACMESSDGSRGSPVLSAYTDGACPTFPPGVFKAADSAVFEGPSLDCKPTTGVLPIESWVSNGDLSCLGKSGVSNI